MMIGLNKGFGSSFTATERVALGRRHSRGVSARLYRGDADDVSGIPDRPASQGGVLDVVGYASDLRR